MLTAWRSLLSRNSASRRGDWQVSSGPSAARELGTYMIAMKLTTKMAMGFELTAYNATASVSTDTKQHPRTVHTPNGRRNNQNINPRIEDRRPNLRRKREIRLLPHTLTLITLRGLLRPLRSRGTLKSSQEPLLLPIPRLPVPPILDRLPIPIDFERQFARDINRRLALHGRVRSVGILRVLTIAPG